MPRKKQEEPETMNATIENIALEFVGTEACVSIGDRKIQPGETIAGPPEVVVELMKRQDFKVKE